VGLRWLSMAAVGLRWLSWALSGPRMGVVQPADVVSWRWEVGGGQGEVEGEMAGGSGLNARTVARRRVQGTYKGKKRISRTHVQIIVRVFGVVGE
jgi:hypothetical protein